MTWKKLGHEIRSFFIGGLVSSSHEAGQILATRGPTSSKVIVNEDIALNYSAFWSAVNLIAGDVSTTPCNLMRRRATGLGKDIYDDHYLFELMHDNPNPEMSVVDFLEAIVAHMLTWGNGYAEIERDRAGRPMALWPITPDRVTPYREQLTGASRLNYGPLQYIVDGRGPALDTTDLLHLHGLGWDGTRGYSVVDRARETIAMGLASQKFGGTFYGNGATFGGVLNVDADVDEDQVKAMREAIEKAHASADRAHKILIIPGGQKFQSLGIPPNEAQFLESRKFEVTEIARWFGVPPHKIGDLEKATFTNIEQQDLDYYKRTLRRVYVRIEKEMGRKLIAAPERFNQFFKFNADVFLRGDIKSRYDALGIARDKGIINADEWRDMEDMNPIAGGYGSTYLVQQAQVPLDQIKELTDASIAAKTAKSTPPAAPKQPEATPAGAESQPADAKTGADLIKARELVLDLQRDLENFQVRVDNDATEIARLDSERRQAVATLRQVESEKISDEIGHRRALTEAQEKAKDVTWELSLAQARLDAEHSEISRMESELQRAHDREAEIRTAHKDELNQRTSGLEIRLAQAERSLVEAREMITDAKAALSVAEARSERNDEEIARKTEEVRQSIAQYATLESVTDGLRSKIDALADRHADIEALTAEVQASALRARVAQDRADQASQSEREARELAEAERTRAADLDRHIVEMQRCISDARHELVTLKTDQASEAGQFRQQIETYESSLESLRARESAARLAVSSAEGALVEQTHLLDVVNNRVALAEAAAASLREQLEQGHVDAEKQIKVLQSQLDQALRSVSLAAAERAALTTHRGRVIAAHREAVFDITRRFLDREVEGVKRMFATPEKLRQKMSGFYAGHQLQLARALLAQVRVHLASMCSDQDPTLLAEDLAARHVALSCADLQAVVNAFPEGDLGSADTSRFATAVNGLLQQWEASRACRIPDELMAHEIDCERIL